MESDLLSFNNVRYAYDRTLPEIVHGVSLDVAPKSFTVIVGPSGSGKSTILKLAIGLAKPTKGSVSLSAKARMIFQTGALLPWATALENVCVGFTDTKLSKKEQEARAHTALTNLGIDHLAGSYPRALSGGQRQRVGIARALVSEPELLLLDEPFSALDTDTADRLAGELQKLHQETGMTMLMVSHSIEDAVVLADTVLVFKEGVIAHTIPIDLPQPRVRTSAPVQELVAKIKALVPGE